MLSNVKMIVLMIWWWISVWKHARKTIYLVSITRSLMIIRHLITLRFFFITYIVFLNIFKILIVDSSRSILFNFLIFLQSRKLLAFFLIFSSNRVISLMRNFRLNRFWRTFVLHRQMSRILRNLGNRCTRLFFWC